MKSEKYIESVKEYIDFIFSLENNKQFIYRGVSNKAYKLLPGIGRSLSLDDKSKILSQKKKILLKESIMLDEFREKIEHIEKCNNTNELIILAQHSGLPTRLLDWTYNPLVALYFSVRKKSENDSAVYISSISDIMCANIKFDYSDIICQFGSEPVTIFKNENKKISDKEIPYEYFKKIQKEHEDIGLKFSIFRPKAKTPRVIVQDSVLILHIDPFSPFDEHVLYKIFIKNKDKENILKQLIHIGIHDFSMFPDCDGLCSFLKKKYEL